MMHQFVGLVRHAQSDFPSHKLAGRLPGVGLSEKGRQQAEELVQRLIGTKPVAIYSSPIRRCLDTASPLATKLRMKIREEPQLTEVDFGSWQGRSMRVLAKTELWRLVQWAPSQATFPGGESVRDLQVRGVAGIEAIRSRHKRGLILAFSHADTIKAIAAHYLGMPLDMFQRIVISNASVTLIGFGDEFPRMLKLSALK